MLESHDRELVLADRQTIRRVWVDILPIYHYIRDFDVSIL